MDKMLWDNQLKIYFKPEEFASPDNPESGYEMDYMFMHRLVSLRKLVNRPFIINSGFRTKEYNQSLIAKGYKASPDSPHLKGLAVDIHITDSSFLYSIIKNALFLKFKRIGISAKGKFIHLDMDDKKEAQEVVWLYE